MHGNVSMVVAVVVVVEEVVGAGVGGGGGNAVACGRREYVPTSSSELVLRSTISIA